MENKFTITAKIATTASEDNPLGLEVWLDNNLCQDINPVTASSTISVEVNDDDSEHELKFVLKNKTQAHTTIDSNGNILRDSVVEIKDVVFDDIDLDRAFYDQAVYTHNFNGTGPETEEKFHGIMGCNGAVVLKFTTPVYLWLLENM